MARCRAAMPTTLCSHIPASASPTPHVCLAGRAPSWAVGIKDLEENAVTDSEQPPVPPCRLELWGRREERGGQGQRGAAAEGGQAEHQAEGVGRGDVHAHEVRHGEGFQGLRGPAGRPESGPGILRVIGHGAASAEAWRCER